MNKKFYVIPQLKKFTAQPNKSMLLSASEEGIGDGGIGSGSDDPDAKQRSEDNQDESVWGSLW